VAPGLQFFRRQLQLLGLPRYAFALGAEEDAPRLRDDQFQMFDPVIAVREAVPAWPPAQHGA
jgi:hypothetical protein